MIAPKKITVTINGQRCEGTAGQTILQIATANQIYIPTLCYLKHLSPWGGCRMCIVEIAGSPKVAPACSTPATDGSVVVTKSERLQHLRRMTLELLFSERNHICPFCPMNNGDCELQQQAYRHGMDAISIPYLYPALPVDLSGRYFGLDHNRCILCTRCVRTCEELEGVHTLDIANRGALNRVVVDLNSTFGESETCTQCGSCVAACPTGALFDKAQAFRGKLNTCTVVHTTCQECPVGCGLLAFTKENRIVEVFGDFDSPVSRGHLCRRGRYETWAEPRARILHPMLNGKPVPWSEALAAIRAASNGQTGVLLSPRITNETIPAIPRNAARVAMFVARNEAAFCAEPEFCPEAMSKLRAADAILVLGAQPSRDNGVVAAAIRTTVRRRGAKLLIFHARKSDLDRFADIAASVVSLERAFWKKVGDTLKDARRPVLVYGPDAITPVGVTVLERLIGVLEKKRGGQPLATIPLPVSANSAALARAGVEPVEEIAPWLDARPLSLLYIVASDEPDGGARLLEQKHVRELLADIDTVVVQASYRSELTDRAKVVLPAATWAERNGTITNFEGRELPVRAVVPPRGEAKDDRTILQMVFG